MRFKAKIDDNHNQIVYAFRMAGASVFSTAGVGKGFPDIVVGINGRNYLIEIKDGSKVKSKRKLTKDEVEFFDSWRGDVRVVENTQDVIDLLKTAFCEQG